MRQKSPIIDDFDTILENLEPFYRLQPKEVRQLITDAANGNNEEILLCSFTKDKGFDDCRFYGETMDWLLGAAKKHIPDVIFPINSLDEPSVLLKKEVNDATIFDWPNLASQSIVDHVAEACAVRGAQPHPTNKTPRTHRVETYGLPFVQSVEEEQDLCLYPEYRDYHGFLNSPTSLRQVAVAVPLLSQAAPYPFADVLVPSPTTPSRTTYTTASSTAPGTRRGTPSSGTGPPPAATGTSTCPGAWANACASPPWPPCRQTGGSRT